ASSPHPFADAFWRGLHALGYSEGQNIKVEFRYTDGRSDRAEEFAEEFVRLGVDVIVAHFTPAVTAAIEATRTIPIVMAPAGAPLQMGIMDSLARPGGNVTGLSAMDAEIGGKRLQLLRELIPNLRRVAVVATTATTAAFSGPYVEDLRLAATSAGLSLEPILMPVCRRSSPRADRWFAWRRSRWRSCRVEQTRLDRSVVPLVLLDRTASRQSAKT